MSDLFWDDPDALKLDWDPQIENQLGLIYVSRNGRRIGRQAAGMAVLPCDAWGFYVPLRETCEEITEFFLRHPLHMLADDTKHHAFLEERLQHYGLSGFIKVRSRCEAFTDVEIVALDPAWPAEFRLGAGILTWPNSD